MPVHTRHQPWVRPCVDVGDEMPTATYQSVEIEKDTEAASSGSSSSSDSGSSKDSVSESGNAHSLV
ncbi:hypothetical protein OsI_17468 [Oryza sativa Indica Group]|uniref:Uncharacterized protein n=1 Tax=Oryza sativa subsp. indica TaxID=39946 RepID=A2XXQ5_ORYSI|nr:hypothetical protein OsI_17468 [Oryza sativa Indica Group]